MINLLSSQLQSNNDVTDLNEVSLRSINPWIELLKNDGTILSSDRKRINAFNGKVADNFKVQDDLPPEPFNGNPFKAEVFLLALNPGYSKTEQQYLAANPSLKTALYKNIGLEFGTFPLLFLNPAFTKSPGWIWWDKKLKPLYKYRLTPEQLSKKICHLQYFPYHSTNYKGIGGVLKSQNFTFQLLRYAIQEKKMIILLRSKRLWLNAVPELEGHYCKLNSAQNVVLSEKNLGTEKFEQLLERLKR